MRPPTYKVFPCEPWLTAWPSQSKYHYALLYPYDLLHSQPLCSLEILPVQQKLVAGVSRLREPLVGVCDSQPFFLRYSRMPLVALTLTSYIVFFRQNFFALEIVESMLLPDGPDIVKITSLLKKVMQWTKVAASSEFAAVTAVSTKRSCDVASCIKSRQRWLIS